MRCNYFWKIIRPTGLFVTALNVLKWHSPSRQWKSEREREWKRMEIHYVCINCDSIGICHLSHQQIVLCRIFLCIHNHADGCLPNGFVYTPKIYTCSHSNTHMHARTTTFYHISQALFRYDGRHMGNKLQVIGQPTGWCSNIIVGSSYTATHPCQNGRHTELYETTWRNYCWKSFSYVKKAGRAMGESGGRGNCSGELEDKSR